MIPASSVLARHDAALVVIDVQERLAAAMPRRELVLRRGRLLIRVASIVGIPVIVTRQYPRGLGDVEPALGELLSEVGEPSPLAPTIDKVRFDCFAESDVL